MLAAALLLHALPLRAQHPDFYLQPDTLVFGYSAGLVESVYVTCDIDLRWYVSNPQAGGDLFAIDVYEGVSSDFIQVRTLQSNRTGSDRRCTFYFRDDNWHSANLVIIQKPYVEPPPTPPEPDPDWDLDIPGNWILSRSYSDPADSSVFHDDITFYDGLGYPVQTVLVGASPAPARRPGEAVIQTERNIVRPVVYDSMRRPDAVSYLPYPAARSGRERETDPLAAQAAWYESAYPGEGALAGVPFPGGRFVRDAHGSTSVLHFVTDHLGSPRAVVRGGDVAARLDLMPSGAALSDSELDGLPGDAARLRFAGKEDLSEPSLGLLPLLDFGARLYDPLTLAWDSPDPLADKYPSLSPYAYCAGDPVNFIDPDGKRIIIGSAFRRFMSKLGVNNYEAKVQSQIEELKNIHPEINDMISFIEDSPITIKVVHPATYHDSQGNHFVFNAFYRSDKTIMYDPENDILPSGKTRPAIIGLAHEFAHVENFLKGTEVQVNRDKARHGDKNEIEKLNEDELHSIQIENLVREVYNIPLRNETYYELPEE